MKLIDTLQFHLENGHITPEKHVRSKHLELAESIANRHKIYLDTRYWILFRDVLLGRRKDQALVDLLEKIRNAVRSKRAICPVSQDSFAEVFSQNDPETLLATVKLLDELSESVCLTELFSRFDFEFHHFMVQKIKGDDAVYRLDQMVWTKSGYVLGFVTPKFNSMPGQSAVAIEKAVFDQIWIATFSDMLDHLGCCSHWKVDPSSVDEMNVGKFDHSSDFNSFKELFMIELSGALDLFKDSLSNIMFRIYLSEFGSRVGPEEKPDAEAGKMAANLIYHAFRLNRITSELPTLRTDVTLHAALRWDKNRKYKPNDLADVRHATMAIPYCDTFLTEKSLCHLIHGKHLKLTEQFHCRTFSDPLEASRHLDELGI